MSTIQTAFITVTCDGPGCDKNATFEASPAGEHDAIQANTWLKNVRHVAPTGAVINGQQVNRKYTYCSDVCEAKAIETGAHNQLEQKRIVPATQQQAAQVAAAAAQAAQLKSGIVTP